MIEIEHSFHSNGRINLKRFSSEFPSYDRAIIGTPVKKVKLESFPCRESKGFSEEMEIESEEDFNCKGILEGNPEGNLEGNSKEAFSKEFGPQIHLQITIPSLAFVLKSKEIPEFQRENDGNSRKSEENQGSTLGFWDSRGNSEKLLCICDKI